MTLINTQFTTVTVHSAECTDTEVVGHQRIDSEPAVTTSSQTRREWRALLTQVRARRQANIRARKELEARGIDPDRFLSHYRVEV